MEVEAGQWEGAVVASGAKQRLVEVKVGQQDGAVEAGRGLGLPEGGVCKRAAQGQ